MCWLRSGICFLYSYRRLRLRENEKEAPKYALEGLFWVLFCAFRGILWPSGAQEGSPEGFERPLEGARGAPRPKQSSKRGSQEPKNRPGWVLEYLSRSED